MYRKRLSIASFKLKPSDCVSPFIMKLHTFWTFLCHHQIWCLLFSCKGRIIFQQMHFFILQILFFMYNPTHLGFVNVSSPSHLKRANLKITFWELQHFSLTLLLLENIVLTLQWKYERKSWTLILIYTSQLLPLFGIARIIHLYLRLHF